MPSLYGFKHVRVLTLLRTRVNHHSNEYMESSSMRAKLPSISSNPNSLQKSETQIANLTKPHFHFLHTRRQLRYKNNKVVQDDFRFLHSVFLQLCAIQLYYRDQSLSQLGCLRFIFSWSKNSLFLIYSGSEQISISFIAFRDSAMLGNSGLVRRDSIQQESI